MVSYAINEQLLGSAVNSFFNKGKFVDMKTLSVRRAPHCDKHKCWKYGEHLNCFCVIIVEQSGRNEERIAKMTLYYRTQLHLAVVH